ncbi:unnamed protein product (macronuclear) [Paramecium tetraurelia]|uniref:Uncharacterized protein n=1 Tax=Paramecium tetraurelia TaxID=5888 RepID=A0BSZ8_PARTE|nr:uncharacterized protein GSPATT00031897001 [Paramecium tetraurelia]CAK61665.1 unnamed protein product [Paramecium tetraurelia]|eukprot:XP_001429063.1 hypothetical protein (macronuclear) [Paramecium tetraurelia strain d4-2]
MRILIINCYDNKDLEKFQHFQFHVMKYLAEQKELIDTENEFYVRNRDTIEDFLYEVESSYVKKESALKFDQLDVIFIIGDCHTRPWAVHMGMDYGFTVSKNIGFVEDEFESIEVTICLGICHASLKYYLINIHKPINLINQNGGKLSDLRELKIQIQQSDMFLENTSGDLYVFNYESSEWIPKLNVGIHLRSAAQEFQSIGRYVVKAPIYKPKQMGSFISKNKNTETVVSIRNVYLQHWAFKDIESRFLAPLLNRWDVHNFQFNNSEKKFICLAESDEGPSIIEYPKALACMFETDTKYPFTNTLLKNFVQYAMYNIKISNASKPFDSIENYHKVNTKTSSILDLLKNNNNQNQKKSTLELMQIRGKNGIASQSQQKLAHAQEEQKLQSMQNNLKRRSSIAHVGFTLNKNVPIRTVEVNAVGKRKIKYQQGQQHSRKISADEAYLKSIRDSEDDIFNEPEIIQKTQILKTPSQSEIRKLLHPEISKSCLEVKEIWIPGHLSEYQKTQGDKRIGKIGGSFQSTQMKRWI